MRRCKEKEKNKSFLQKKGLIKGLLPWQKCKRNLCNQKKTLAYSDIWRSDLRWMRSHWIVTLHLLVSFSGFWYIGWYCCRWNLNGYRTFSENLLSCVRLSRVYPAAVVVWWVHRRVLLWLCAILRIHYTILEVRSIMIQVGGTRFSSRWWRSDKAGHTLRWWSVVHTCIVTEEEPKATMSQSIFLYKTLPYKIFQH